jgi:hypothetical protein
MTGIYLLEVLLLFLLHLSNFHVALEYWNCYNLDLRLEISPCHLRVNKHVFASIERVVRISGGTYADLHTMADFSADKLFNSSSEPLES